MTPFSDVPEGSPNSDAIERVAASGLMAGQTKPDGSRVFRPNDFITRRELAVILDRMNVAELLGGYLYPQASAPAPEQASASHDA